MIHVKTPSRLHFGLIDPAGVTDRRYGSVGLMIDAPGITLSVEPAPEWSFAGPLANRARAIVDQLFIDRPELRDLSHRVQIQQAAPEHVGLGTGTQLSLSLLRALAESWSWEHRSARNLALLGQRGRRSAIGIRGFERGGFLVDRGKKENEAIAAVAARRNFPTEWPIILVLPSSEPGLHGRDEDAAFALLEQQQQAPWEHPSPLDHPYWVWLALKNMLDALEQMNFKRFSEYLHKFNRSVGSAFRSVQNGTYASPQIAEMVEWLTELGVEGVGQSSWGPTVFALAQDQDNAEWIVKQLRRHYHFGNDQILITRANNKGAQLWKS